MGIVEPMEGPTTTTVWSLGEPQDELIQIFGGGEMIRAICSVELDGRPMLVTGDDRGTVTIWDARNGDAMHRSGPIQRVIRSNDRGITSLATIVIDGRPMLAVAGQGGEVNVLSADLQQTVALFIELGTEVDRIPLDGRDRLVVSGGPTRHVGPWPVSVVDPTTMQTLAQAEGRLASPVEIDGRQWLALVRDEGTVHIWDPATGEELTRFEISGEGWVESVIATEAGWLGADTPPLLITSRGGRLLALEAGTGRLLSHTALSIGARRIAAVRSGVRCHVAVVQDHHLIPVWDLQEEITVRWLTGHAEQVQTITALAVDQRQLTATADAGGRIMVWDPEAVHDDGYRHDRWAPRHGLVDLFVGDRPCLAVGRADGTVEVWDPASNSMISSNSDPREVSPFGDLRTSWLCGLYHDRRWSLVSLADNGRSVVVWDPGDGRVTHRFEDVFWPTLCAVTLGDRPCVVMAAEDGVAVWDLVEDRIVSMRPSDDFKHWPTYQSPSLLWPIDLGDRSLVAVGLPSLQLWDPADDVIMPPYQNHLGEVRDLCTFDVGSTAVASVDGAGRVCFWDPVSRKDVLPRRSFGSTLSAICSLKRGDGQYFAVGGQLEGVEVIESATGRSVHRIPTRSNVLALSARGSELAIGTKSGTILVAIEW